MTKYYIFNPRYEKFHKQDDNWQLEAYCQDPDHDDRDVYAFLDRRQMQHMFDTMMFENIDMFTHWVLSRCYVYVNEPPHGDFVVCVGIPFLRRSHDMTLQYYEVYRPVHTQNGRENFTITDIDGVVRSLVAELQRQHKSTVESLRFFGRVAGANRIDYPR